MRRQLIHLIFLVLFSSMVLGQKSQTPTPQWRPVYHFTPLKNWTNDPNGIIYLNGIYHLYNQQNPYENKWGHMSWGHAISTDLVHWKHLAIAIPETIDKDTTWRFSGCAVWDKNNSSGFCKNGKCLVAIYTADQPNIRKESQFIAYSNDGGMTYSNYPNNPVLDLHKKDFRDPNVSWNAELNKWLMVVALPTEHKVLFYESENLKQWALLGEFGNSGYCKAAWECPSLMQLPVEGNPGKKKWILMVSAGGAEKGSFMQYFVGEFDGKTFKNDNPADSILTVDYGDCLYAAIPWNNLPDDKKILIGWMVPGSQETYPWRGQMSIPRDLSLRETINGLRLVQLPSSVIQNNLAQLSKNRVMTLKDRTLSNKDYVIYNQQALPGNAYWLDAVFSIKSPTDLAFRIGQKKDKDNNTISETIVGYNSTTNKLYVDRNLSGNVKLKSDKLKEMIDLVKRDSTIRIQILFDKSSLELFFNNGEKVLSCYIFPDQDANGLSVFSTGGTVVVKSLKIWDLSKIMPD